MRVGISDYALERREERHAEHARIAEGGARATHGARATTEAITHGAPRRPNGIADIEERYGGRSGARSTRVSLKEERARHTERARRPKRSRTARRDDRTASRNRDIEERYGGRRGAPNTRVSLSSRLRFTGQSAPWNRKSRPLAVRFASPSMVICCATNILKESLRLQKRAPQHFGERREIS